MHRHTLLTRLTVFWIALALAAPAPALALRAREIGDGSGRDAQLGHALTGLEESGLEEGEGTSHRETAARFLSIVQTMPLVDQVGPQEVAVPRGHGLRRVTITAPRSEAGPREGRRGGLEEGAAWTASEMAPILLSALAKAEFRPARLWSHSPAPPRRFTPDGTYGLQARLPTLRRTSDHETRWSAPKRAWTPAGVVDRGRILLTIPALSIIFATNTVTMGKNLEPREEFQQWLDASFGGRRNGFDARALQECRRLVAALRKAHPTLNIQSIHLGGGRAMLMAGNGHQAPAWSASSRLWKQMPPSFVAERLVPAVRARITRLSPAARAQFRRQAGVLTWGQAHSQFGSSGV